MTLSCPWRIKGREMFRSSYTRTRRDLVSRSQAWGLRIWFAALAALTLIVGAAGGCGPFGGGQDPADTSVVATQAVFDRDFEWLAENGAPQWEDFLEEDNKADDVARLAEGAAFQEKIEGEFRYETEEFSWDDPPPEDVDVEVIENSYVDSEADEDVYRAEFDYALGGAGGGSSGGSGEVSGESTVILVRAGPNEEYRVAGVQLDYPEDQSLTLGPTT